MVEVDGSRVVYRTKDDLLATGGGRNHDGRPLITSAAECVEGGKAERDRLAVFPDLVAPTLKEFEEANIVEVVKLN